MTRFMLILTLCLLLPVAAVAETSVRDLTSNLERQTMDDKKSSNQTATEPVAPPARRVMDRPGGTNILDALRDRIRGFFGAKPGSSPVGGGSRLGVTPPATDGTTDAVLRRIRGFRYSPTTGRPSPDGIPVYHSPFAMDNPLLDYGPGNPQTALRGSGADGKPGLTRSDSLGPTVDPRDPTRLAVDGDGRYPGRAELPSHVFSPRRQTDQMVGQMQKLLPPDIQADTAFLNPDRVVQNPEQALRDLEGKKYVVLHGCFMGMGSDKVWDEAGGDVNLKARVLHQRQFEVLSLALQLVRSRGLKVRDVFYAVGDTNVRNPEYQEKLFAYLDRNVKPELDRVLKQNGVAPTQASIPFGADEAAAIAMARQITARRDVTATLTIEGARHPQKYDAYQPTEELARKSLALIGVKEVRQGGDLNLLACAAGGAATRAAIAKLPLALRSRTLVVDSRKENGALDGSLVPPLDALGFSAWGTFNNAFGQGVAQAVISEDYLRRAAGQAEARKDPAILARARGHVKELVTQSVAHDAFVTGYQEGGNADDAELHKKVLETVGIDWNHERYCPEEKLPLLTAVVTDHVNAKLQAKYGAAAPRVLVLPQFNRTFEMVPVTEGEMGAVTGFLDRARLERIYRAQPRLFTPEMIRRLKL